MGDDSEDWIPLASTGDLVLGGNGGLVRALVEWGIEERERGKGRRGERERGAYCRLVYNEGRGGRRDSLNVGERGHVSGG